MSGTCTVPDVYPPTIADQYYLLQSVAYNQGFTFTFDFGPPLFKQASYGWAFSTFSQQAVITGSGNVPADPTWGTLAATNDKETISTTSTDHVGEWDMEIFGTISNGSSTATGSSTFKVFIFEIVP